MEAAMKSLLVLMLVSSAAMADNNALLECRKLDDGPVRLACYNAIPVAPAGSAVVIAAPAARHAAALSKDELDQSFGKEQVAPASGPRSIETTVDGDFDGWVPNQRIRLANGQVWRVTDDTSEETMKVYKNPEVKIRRGAMGAIYMDIDGARSEVRVRRVK